MSASANGCSPVMSVSASCRAVDDSLTAAEGAAALRRLIDEANASSRHLQELLDRARRSDAGQAQASVRLQERLRLGARMLRAFQTQQQATEVAQAALLEQVAALERRVEGLAAAAERAGGRGSELEQISHRAARANQRLSRTLAALERRSGAARAILERLEQMVAVEPRR